MYQTPKGTDPNAQPVSFETVLALPHTVHIDAQIQDPTGKVLLQGFALTGGDVTVDAGAQFRRSLRAGVMPFGAGAGYSSGPADATVGMPKAELDTFQRSLIPSKPGDPVSPYGNLIRVWYGIEVPGYFDYTATPANLWRISLGVFRLADAQVQDGGGAPSLSITAFDHSRTVSRNRLTGPWIVTSGTNWGDAIIALAKDRYPALKSRAHTVTATSPLVVVDPEQDPWQVITEWAAAFGAEAFFDNEGYLVIQPQPDPSKSPVSWTYADGSSSSNALVLSTGKTMSDEPGYNGVVLTAESTTLTSVLRSEAWDTNPSSPTYYLGQYGKVPKFVSNPYVATQAQADAAAQAELLRSLGGTEQVSLAAIPNPAHEAGDVIRVVRPSTKLDDTAAIESFTIPLDTASPMSINCLRKRSLT